MQKINVNFILLSLMCAGICLLFSQCKKEDPNVVKCKVVDGNTNNGIDNAQWYLLRAGENTFNADNTNGYTNSCGEFSCNKSGYLSFSAQKEGYHDYLDNSANLFSQSQPVVKLFAKAEVLLRIHNDPNLNEFEKVRIFGFWQAGIMEHDESMDEDEFYYTDTETGNQYLELWGEYIQGTDTVIQYHDFWIEPFIFNQFEITY